MTAAKLLFIMRLDKKVDSSDELWSLINCSLDHCDHHAGVKALWAVLGHPTKSAFAVNLFNQRKQFIMHM